MGNPFLIYSSLYFLLGLAAVLFILNFPLLYLQQFKRSMYILKTASFKLKAKDNPELLNKSPQEKSELLKKDQVNYELESEAKIQEESLKQVNSNYQSKSILIIILTWPLILIFFMLTEILRVIYLSQEDLGGF